MAEGLQIWDNNGTLVFDSNLAPGGCLVEVYTTTPTPLAKHYPQFAGRTAIVRIASGFLWLSPNVDYSNGYPVVEFPGNPYDPRYNISYFVVMV